MVMLCAPVWTVRLYGPFEYTIQRTNVAKLVQIHSLILMTCTVYTQNGNSIKSKMCSVIASRIQSQCATYNSMNYEYSLFVCFANWVERLANALQTDRYSYGMIIRKAFGWLHEICAHFGNAINVPALLCISEKRNCIFKCRLPRWYNRRNASTSQSCCVVSSMNPSDGARLSGLRCTFVCAVFFYITFSLCICLQFESKNTLCII